VISVIVPTVQGREDFLARCELAYAAHTTDYELIVVTDEATCGLAWNIGAAQAAGDYIHFSADDLEPHDGWWQAAKAVADDGFLPAPRILNTDGSLQSCGDWEREQETGTWTPFSRIPFLTRGQWERFGPSLPIHYYTDNWFSARGRGQGTETVVHRGYLFTHHLAAHKRGAGMSWQDRMAADHRLFELYASGEIPLT
jgi:hypothetical protein